MKIKISIYIFFFKYPATIFLLVCLNSARIPNLTLSCFFQVLTFCNWSTFGLALGSLYVQLGWFWHVFSLILVIKENKINFIQLKYFYIVWLKETSSWKMLPTELYLRKRQLLKMNENRRIQMSFKYIFKCYCFNILLLFSIILLNEYSIVAVYLLELLFLSGFSKVI